MSLFQINNYYKDLDNLKRFGGSNNEQSIRPAFERLLNHYCQKRDFLLVNELFIKSKLNTNIRLDGIVKDALRLDWGYWEGIKWMYPPTPPLKGGKFDNLDQEIATKLNNDGYPDDNILFEDSQTAVLYQNGREILRISMQIPDQLDKILNLFLDYQRPEVKDFREAISSFKQDLPTILTTLRNLINPLVRWAISGQENDQSVQDVKIAHLPHFKQELNTFLALCQESINPDITVNDVREIMIQHILTEDIFINIFNEGQFHQENNISKSLRGVLDTFFTGEIKRNTLKTINNYYSVIIRTAANIVNHHEKQKFLKVVYEEFYKAYNPLTADKLGLVYTPNEIVKFMLESTDYLLFKHFGKFLGDQNVEILDPATGTGTFITEIIEYLPTNNLKYKYKNEIHCNEVSILPYYIANLNIEYTFQQKMGEYLEFNNICLVDTLDSTIFSGKQMDLFSMTKENTPPSPPFKGGLGGVYQNDRKISVIIGNPPYNAKQENYSQNNANRGYQNIDKRIKDTYVKEGSTQNQIVLYDMYTRFIRWATDRLNNNGIIAFITNNSFIDALTFDGFRKVIAEEFDYVYTIDLGGNIRAGDQSGNVFNIMVGVAITFFVKKSDSPHPLGEGLEVRENCQIFYNSLNNFNSGQEKLQFLASHKFAQIPFVHITPDKNADWINQVDNDFEELLPLIDKNVKSGKSDQAIFKLFTNGLKTQRDEWVYDFSEENLTKKVQFLINIYQQTIEDDQFKEKNNIKWDRELSNYLKRKINKEFNQEQIIFCLYRPFTKQYFYFDKHFNGMTYQWFNIYNPQNKYMIIPGLSSPKDFHTLASNYLIDLNCLPAGCQCLPLYTYENGDRLDNISDWGLQQFRDYYQPSPPQPPSFSERGGRRLSDNSSSPHPVGEGLGVRANPPTEEKLGVRKITKLDIFHYIYAVLHNPKYREKYEQNLKRDFPRIPFYDDFNQWKNWGKQLMDLHLNYETIKPYPLQIVETLHATSLHSTPKPKFKIDKTKGQIIIDEITTLENVPEIAWEYTLGNRSALEWILDQYKEKKIKDETISKHFNNYHFSDYKETVIDLFKKVTTVSVETLKIITSMNKE